jgi:hypothetical protein
MTKALRHGEIAFAQTKTIPKLPEVKTTIFATGSHGNNHSFKGGKLYLIENPEDNVIGYFVAKDTLLFHPEHGNKKGEKLPDGKYELRKQHEYTPSGLIPVID